MTILITGGAGYIGYNFVRALHKKDGIEEIRLLDNLSRTGHHFFTGSEKLPRVRFIRADILDGYSLDNALKGVEVVYHFAAFVSQPYNHLQNLQYEQINRWGTLSLCRSIRDCPTVKKCIYLSSTAVYGFGEISDTGVQPTPNNAYGESKFHGEQYWRTLANHTDIHVFRAANVFGYNPCLRTDSVLNSWVLSALTERRFPIYGSGDQMRAFVSMEKLTADLLSVLDHQKSVSEEVSILFSNSLNKLKDWLLSRLPETEFTYLNRNQEFPGQYFIQYPFLKEHEVELDRHLENMRAVII